MLRSPHIVMLKQEWNSQLYGSVLSIASTFFRPKRLEDPFEKFPVVAWLGPLKLPRLIRLPGYEPRWLDPQSCQHARRFCVVKQDRASVALSYHKRPSHLCVLHFQAEDTWPESEGWWHGPVFLLPLSNLWMVGYHTKLLQIPTDPMFVCPCYTN